ncbi:SIS domain-containing protein [Robiginitomaculum antarcticum]|uniref:SIS domain-containing protein n=1 Tax=Robiginitomaculum antarcticum TaxID=437507 RepID=UPI000376EC38|nr:SIS domain-containing protein [Robiginitomaculum antarcticum]
MSNKPEHKSKMFKEAGEAHMRVRDQLMLNKPDMSRLASQLQRSPPQFVMTCGRGSSSHAGVYARYLIETQLGIPVLPAAPSLNSVYAVKQKLDGVLFLAISQSGESPDILASAQAAKSGGAYVVAIVNNEASPLAALSHMVIPIHAGEEKSVAATKTFICTLSAIADLVARWGKISKLSEGLNSLPVKLKKAFQINWDTTVNDLENTQSLFVISRGFGLGIAKEAALKFKETCGIHAEAFSAAEIKHGPMALVNKGFPVMIFSTSDNSQSSIDDVAQLFISRESHIFATGRSYNGSVRLPTVESALPELLPIISIQTFYRFINALSFRRGLDPDMPEYLSKITKTV